MENKLLPLRPLWSQVRFEDLEDEIEWAEKEGKQRVVIICSCPSQIGNDRTIMRQVGS